MGHEYVGIVDEVGADVKDVQVGQFVVGSFASDNTCEICLSGYQNGCVHRQGVGATQAEFMRIHLADGTLGAIPQIPDADKVQRC